MRMLGVIGVLAFTVASTAVGVRLLRLAHRTRQVPELAMGLAFVASATLGFPLLTVASLLVQAHGSAEIVHALTALGAFFTYCGYVGLGIGSWRIFRPAERWPKLPIALCTTVLLIATATVAGAPDLGLRDLAFWSGIGVGSLTFGWNALESFLLYGPLRRRLRLGLADPAVVNRVLMWGVAPRRRSG